MANRFPLRFAAGALAPVLAAVALGGCGGDDKLDSGKLESDLKSSLEKTTRDKIGDVECPGDIKIARGRQTTCTTKNAAKQEIHIVVTQTDDNGHVKYVVG